MFSCTSALSVVVHHLILLHRLCVIFRVMDFPGHFEQIFQQLNYQRVHSQLCDCVIVVGSRHFKAHRSVLAACSTHFRALFTVAEGDASMNMIQLDSEVQTLTTEASQR